MAKTASKTSTRIGVIVGSIRRGSYSRRVARALIDRAPAGWDCRFIEIRDLPLYDQDLDAHPRAQWTRFRKAVAACDALLFVTPEYNRSIPGALKNATDIGSRPGGENVFDGKPAAIVSVTPYTSGGMAANHALRQSMVYINLAVMAQPEAYISEAAELVDARNQVHSRKGDQKLRAFMTGFAAWIDRVGPGGADSFEQFLQQHVTAARRGRLEVLASGSNGSLGWWNGVQHAAAGSRSKASATPQPVTEIFRRGAEGWQLVHRHG